MTATAIITELIVPLLIMLAVVEGICVAGLILLHRYLGVFYLPRNAPRLSKKCRRFIRHLLDSGGKGDLMVFDSELGWSPRPDISPGGKYSTNSLGARGHREYLPDPPSGKIRITTFGDCLTFGDGSSFEDTWQVKLEALDDRFEVINLGVEGYGPDQAYLRYIKSRKVLHGQSIVMMSVVSSNIFKPLNIFRPFYSYDHGIMMSKPGSTVTNGSLEMIPNPIGSLEQYDRLLENTAAELKRIGALDYYFQRTFSGGRLDVIPHHRLLKIIVSEYRRRRQTVDGSGFLIPRSTALRTTLKVFERFYDEAVSSRSIPLFVLFPLKNEIDIYRKKGRSPYSPVISYFREKGYRYVDMLVNFTEKEEFSGKTGFYDGRHFSAAANRIIAGTLHDELHALFGDSLDPDGSPAVRG